MEHEVRRITIDDDVERVENHPSTVCREFVACVCCFVNNNDDSRTC